MSTPCAPLFWKSTPRPTQFWKSLCCPESRSIHEHPLALPRIPQRLFHGVPTLARMGGARGRLPKIEGLRGLSYMSTPCAPLFWKSTPRPTQFWKSLCCLESRGIQHSHALPRSYSTGRHRDLRGKGSISKSRKGKGFIVYVNPLRPPILEIEPHAYTTHRVRFLQYGRLCNIM